MNKNKLRTLGLVLGCCAAASVQAGIINPGFDSGLTGWTSDLNSGSASSKTTHINHDSTVMSAPAGTHFLELKAGDANTWVTVYQSVTLSVNESISGYAAFSGYDVMPRNDAAAVWVLSGSQTIGTSAALWQKDISQVGNFGHSPWQSWSFQAPSDGDYTVVFGVMNSQNGLAKDASYGLFTAVPEPSTWLAGALAGFMTIFTGFRQSRIKILS